METTGGDIGDYIGCRVYGLGSKLLKEFRQWLN